MNFENLPLLLILVLSILGNNNSVAIATSFLLLVKLIGLDNYLPLIESHGLQLGIIFITIAVLIPLAKGSITFNDMGAVFKNPMGIIALAAGILVAWLAGRGVPFMTTSPEVVTPLIIGTVIGVACFHGLAVGPLIASGMVWILLSITQVFK
jgi:uncharacterized membrane protein (DUF441 family)